MRALTAYILAAPVLEAFALLLDSHSQALASNGPLPNQNRAIFIDARAQRLDLLHGLKLSGLYDAQSHLYSRSTKDKNENTAPSSPKHQISTSHGAHEESQHQPKSIISNPFHQLESHNSPSYHSSQVPPSPFHSPQQQSPTHSQSQQHQSSTGPSSHHQEPLNDGGSPKHRPSTKKQGTGSNVNHGQNQKPSQHPVPSHEYNQNHQSPPPFDHQLTFKPRHGGHQEPSSPGNTHKESTFVVPHVRPLPGNQQQPLTLPEINVNIKYPPPILTTNHPHDRSQQGSSKNFQQPVPDQRQQSKHLNFDRQRDETSSDQSSSHKIQSFSLGHHKKHPSSQRFGSQVSLTSVNSRQPFLPGQGSTGGSTLDLGDHQPKTTWVGQAGKLLKVGWEGAQHNVLPVVAGAMGGVAPALGAAGVIKNNTGLLLGGTALGMGAASASTLIAVKDGWEKKKERDRQRQRSDELRRQEQLRAGYSEPISEEAHAAQQNQLEKGLLHKDQTQHSRRAAADVLMGPYENRRGSVVPSKIQDWDKVLSNVHLQDLLHPASYGLRPLEQSQLLHPRSKPPMKGSRSDEDEFRVKLSEETSRSRQAPYSIDTPSMALTLSQTAQKRQREPLMQKHHLATHPRLAARGLDDINPSSKNEEHLYNLLRSDSSMSKKRHSALDSSTTGFDGYLDRSGHSISTQLMHLKGLHGGPSMDILRSDRWSVDSPYVQMNSPKTHQQPVDSPRSQISRYSLQQTLNTRPVIEHLETQNPIEGHSPISNAQLSDTQNGQQPQARPDSSQKQTTNLQSGDLPTTQSGLQSIEQPKKRLDGPRFGHQNRLRGGTLHDKAKLVVQKAGTLANRLKMVNDRTSSRKSCRLCIGRGAPAPSDMETVKSLSDSFKSPHRSDPVKSVFGHLLSADQGNVDHLGGTTLIQKQPAGKPRENVNVRNRGGLEHFSAHLENHPGRDLEHRYNNGPGTHPVLYPRAALDRRDAAAEQIRGAEKSHVVDQRSKSLKSKDVKWFKRLSSSAEQEPKNTTRSMRILRLEMRGTEVPEKKLEIALQKLSSRALRGTPQNQDISKDSKVEFENLRLMRQPPNINNIGLQGLIERSKGPVGTGIEMQNVPQENLRQHSTSKTQGLLPERDDQDVRKMRQPYQSFSVRTQGHPLQRKDQNPEPVMQSGFQYPSFVPDQTPAQSQQKEQGTSTSRRSRRKQRNKTPALYNNPVFNPLGAQQQPKEGVSGRKKSHPLDNDEPQQLIPEPMRRTSRDRPPNPRLDGRGKGRSQSFTLGDQNRVQLKESQRSCSVRSMPSSNVPKHTFEVQSPQRPRSYSAEQRAREALGSAQKNAVNFASVAKKAIQGNPDGVFGIGGAVLTNAAMSLLDSLTGLRFFGIIANVATASVGTIATLKEAQHGLRHMDKKAEEERKKKEEEDAKKGHEGPKKRWLTGMDSTLPLSRQRRDLHNIHRVQYQALSRIHARDAMIPPSSFDAFGGTPAFPGSQSQQQALASSNKHHQRPSSSPNILSTSEVQLSDTQYKESSTHSPPSSPEKIHPPSQMKFSIPTDSPEQDSCHATIGKVKELIKAEMLRASLHRQHSQQSSSEQDALHREETLERIKHLIHSQTSQLEHKLHSEQIRLLDLQAGHHNQAYRHSKRKETCNTLIGCIVCLVGQLGLWGGLVPNVPLQSTAACLTTVVGTNLAVTNQLCGNSPEIDAAMKELQEYNSLLRRQVRKGMQDEGGSELRRLGSFGVGKSVRVDQSGRTASLIGSPRTPDEEGRRRLRDFEGSSMHRRDGGEEEEEEEEEEEDDDDDEGDGDIESEENLGKGSTEGGDDWFGESWAPGILGEEELEDE